MKYLLYSLLCVFAAGMTSASPDVQASRGRPGAKTALVLSSATPPMSCPDGFSHPIQPIEAFPDFGFSEPAPMGYADGYHYDNPGNFECFIPRSTDALVTSPSQAHWLATTRLLPAFPQIEDAFFLPIGWHWIEFDR